MIYILFCVVLFLPSVPRAEEAWCSGAQTQRDLNVCSSTRASNVRGEMNKRIDKIKDLIANRPQKLATFEAAQKTWEEYVQAQVAFLYIDHTGSAAPMCEADAEAYLVNQRIKQLDAWVADGKQDANTCGYYLFYDSDPCPEAASCHAGE